MQLSAVLGNLPDMQSWQELTDQHLAPTSPYPFGITIERAEGSWLYAPDGKRYLDMISGIGVTNVGHRNPVIIDAIRRQLDRHLHVMVYGEYVQETPSKLAGRLASLLPPSLNCCYLVNSGTEANEGALKLAKRATGRHRIVSCRNSYHGSTHGSLSISGNEVKKQAFRPLLPDIHFIRFNALDDLSTINDQTACVIMETVQGDAGVRIPDANYLKAVRKRCDETGALLIFDEIQCGMGRTGKLFAFEHFGVVPDILTLGKALGGGLPIGAFIASRERMQLFTHDPMLGHITTFGGNPLCAAAALGTIDVLLTPGLLTQAEEKGKRIAQELSHPHIREIRRIGMFFAIEFDTAERVNRIVSYARDHGVISYWFLSNPHCFRLAPPLTISNEEITQGCAILREAIEAS